MSTRGRARRADRHARGGFSTLELLVVMTIMAILAGIVAPSMGTVQARMDTGSAKDGFVLYTARARSLAIDRGALTTLTIDPATDRVIIAVGNTPSDSIDFMMEYGVDLATSTASVVVACYSSRGIAMPSCNSGLDNDVRVTFSRGEESAIATLRPLGQVKR